RHVASEVGVRQLELGFALTVGRTAADPQVAGKNIFVRWKRHGIHSRTLTSNFCALTFKRYFAERIQRLGVPETNQKGPFDERRVGAKQPALFWRWRPFQNEPRTASKERNQE